MNTAIPVFEAEEYMPGKKRRGVTVITQHGRALTFGISRDRTEHFLEAMAQHKEQELTVAMQEHKAARLKMKPAPARKSA